jgi:hypothetical protein
MSLPCAAAPFHAILLPCGFHTSKTLR